MKKNIWKRLLSLALALVMVAGWMPRMATEAHAAEPITLSDNTFTTSPGEGFAFRAYFYCDECKKEVYIDSNIENHNFEIISFTYKIANGTAQWDLTANYQGCRGSGTGTNKYNCSYNCTEKLSRYLLASCGWNQNTKKYHGAIDVYITREKTAHQGDATCKTAANCTLCGTSYTNANNHEKRNEFTYSVNTTDSTKHDVKYACCGATKETVVHTAEPTYTVNVTDHTKHDKTYSCCEGIAETTGHSYTYTANDFVLTETCTNNCGHQAIASIVPREAIYTGSEITDAATISCDSETWAGDKPVLSFENNVTVGTATVKMTAGDATASTTFKINPASLSYATVALDPASGIYNGKLHSKPSYNLTYNGQELVKGTDYIVDGQWTGDFLNAGDSILTLKGEGNFAGTKTLTYTIGKATPAFTAPAAKELTYNGQAKALVEAGSVNPGKLLYSLDGNDYSETVPTATNAGNYTVYYMVEGLDTKNYNEISSGSVPVTIRKAEAPDITFPEVLNAITYGQKLEEAKLSSYANDYGIFHWNAPTSVPNAGTAGYALDFYPNALALQNYDWKNVGEAQWIADRNALCICPNVTVNKAAAAITTNPIPNNLTYNGEDQPLVTAGSVTGGTMVYSLEMEGEYTETLPQAMDAGTYTVWYKVDADSNHTDSEPASVTVEIKKANASVDVAPTAIAVYNGREQTLVIPVESMGGTVYYSLDGVTYTDYVPKGINAQEYTVYYKVVGDANHNDMEPKTVTATIAPWNIETAPCKAGVRGGPFTYNGQEHTPTPQIEVWVDGYPVPESPYEPGADVRLTEGTDYTVTYSNNVNAGEAVVTFTGKGNYTGTITKKFTIDPKPITVTIADKTSVYGNEIAKLTATDDGVVNNDSNVYSLATEATKTSNVGTYPITGTTVDSNYDITFVNGTYTVTNATNQWTTEPSITGWTYGETASTPSGKAKFGDVTVTYAGKGTENFTAEAPTQAGDYTAKFTVTGNDNYNGLEETRDFTIAKKALSVTEAVATGREYDGTKTVAITEVTLDGVRAEDTVAVDLTDLTGTLESANKGTYTSVTLPELKLKDDKGNYTLTRPAAAVKTNNVEITAKPITVTVADIADQTWTGSALTPAVVSPTGLVKETDEYCTVTYTDNTNVGLAIVKVEEKGNYTFTAIEKTFLIVPNESLIAGLTTANVTSADKTDVDKAAAMMNNADLNDAPAEDKADWETLKTLANDLQDQLEAADAADETQNIQDVEGINAGNVKLDQKQDLKDALKDLESAKENYYGNYTAEEKAALDADIKRVEDALAAIERVEDFNTAIDDPLLKEDVTTDMDAATEEAIKDAQDAYNALSDYEKTLVDPADKTRLGKLVATITDYKITKGDGGRCTVGSGKTLSFTANGPVRKFDYVQVNGKTIASSNYTVTEGSTIITLKSSYLDKLGYGKHKIQIFYTDGSTDVANFRIYMNGGNPFTGDNTHMLFFAGIMMTSLLCMGMMVMFVPKKKGKYQR